MHTFASQPDGPTSTTCPLPLYRNNVAAIVPGACGRSVGAGLTTIRDSVASVAGGDRDGLIEPRDERRLHRRWRSGAEVARRLLLGGIEGDGAARLLVVPVAQQEERAGDDCHHDHDAGEDDVAHPRRPARAQLGLDARFVQSLRLREGAERVARVSTPEGVAPRDRHVARHAPREAREVSLLFRPDQEQQTVALRVLERIRMLLVDRPAVGQRVEEPTDLHLRLVGRPRRAGLDLEAGERIAPLRPERSGAEEPALVDERAGFFEGRALVDGGPR